MQVQSTRTSAECTPSLHRGCRPHGSCRQRSSAQWAGLRRVAVACRSWRCSQVAAAQGTCLRQDWSWLRWLIGAAAGALEAFHFLAPPHWPSRRKGSRHPTWRGNSTLRRTPYVENEGVSNCLMRANCSFDLLGELLHCCYRMAVDLKDVITDLPTKLHHSGIADCGDPAVLYDEP